MENSPFLSFVIPCLFVFLFHFTLHTFFSQHDVWYLLPHLPSFPFSFFVPSLSCLLFLVPSLLSRGATVWFVQLGSINAMRRLSLLTDSVYFKCGSTAGFAELGVSCRC